MLLVTAPSPVHAMALGAELGAPVVAGPAGRTRLRVGRVPGGGAVPPAEVTELCRRLAPLRVEVCHEAALEGMVLELGSVATVTDAVRVVVPPPWRTRRTLDRLPVAHHGLGDALLLAATVQGPSRQTLATKAMAAILALPDWTCGQDAHGLRLRAGIAGCRALLPPMPLRVVGVEHGVGGHPRLLAALRRDGWAIEARPAPAGKAPAFDVCVPEDLDPSVGRGLLRALADHVPPTVPYTVGAGADPVVEVHLARSAPSVPAPPAPDTLRTIVVRTDDLEAAGVILDTLRGMAIGAVEARVGLAFEGGFRVRHHTGLVRSPWVRDVTHLLRRTLDRAGLADRHPPNVLALEERGLEGVMEIDLPLRAARDGSLLRTLLANAGAYHVHVGGMRRPGDLMEPVRAALAAAGATPRVSELHGDRGSPEITVGSAPTEVGRFIAEAVEKATGVALRVRRNFNATDDDIWIVVPPGTRVRRPAETRAARFVGRREERPFLEVGDHTVRVGESVLPRGGGHPLAPAPERFAHACMDDSTVAMLDHLALSVRLREHALLEGPTAAGKTSAILHLAALLRQPVVRINLSGQTDTGELLGRYAPRGGTWEWQEGAVPRAMREGWWVILDEVNLAEPSVIERLNPVLERVPSLVLTEGDGTRFGPGGVPVAPGFLVFATMNPSDGAYGGRAALSPALRDRFAAQMACPAPSERDLRQLLDRLVFGEQPAVALHGVGWEGWIAPGEPPHGALAAVPGIVETLDALVRFHASVEAASTTEDEGQRLGGTRREPLVVSRRTLLSVLDYVALRLGPQGDGATPFAAFACAIDRYYGRRLPGSDDARAIVSLAEAAGLFRAAPAQVAS